MSRSRKRLRHHWQCLFISDLVVGRARLAGRHVRAGKATAGRCAPRRGKILLTKKS
jgi:hypothetical protein